MHTQVVLEGKSLLQLCRVNQVIVFYPKTMNKRQGKNDLEIFHDQIFFKRIENVLLRNGKTNNFLHVREHVVESACLNRCLLELMARKLRRFVSKIFKILKLYGFKIKIFY